MTWGTFSAEAQDNNGGHDRQTHTGDSAAASATDEHLLRRSSSSPRKLTDDAPNAYRLARMEAISPLSARVAPSAATTEEERKELQGREGEEEEGLESERMIGGLHNIFFYLNDKWVPHIFFNFNTT